MALEAIARLEQLVDRILAEKVDLQQRNRELAAERDRLVKDRSRVSGELDKLLEKLEHLEGKAR